MIHPAERPVPGGRGIEDLPAESFQHICSFCTLHELAVLRTVSKSIRDCVDDSLTSRTTFAEPTTKIKPKGTHDLRACYVRVTLQRTHQPINAVFSRYNKEHNYLEFTQRDTAGVDLSGEDFTLGRLDFNNWGAQLLETTRSNRLAGPSSPEESASTAQQQGRPRRSSITQAGVIRATQIHTEQELARGGPITPMPTTRSTLSSIFGSSSTAATTPPAQPQQSTTAGTTIGQRLNHMSQYVFSSLASTGPQTGMTTEQLSQEALRLFHTVEPEVLSSKKQYKFELSEGVHYLGDNDFIIRYTIKKAPAKEDEEKGKEESTPTTAPTTTTAAGTSTDSSDNFHLDREHLEFKVDYIRASWRFISSGTPTRLDSIKSKATSHARDDDSEAWRALLNPLPELRIGRMYAHRLNMVLEEVGRQNVSAYVRGELRDHAYDASLLPKKFIFANLRAEPVLRWITQEHFEGEQAQGQGQQQGGGGPVWANPWNDQEGADSDWEMVTSTATTTTSRQLSQYSLEAAKTERDAHDREELTAMVKTLKQKTGYLTARNILEEMLACQGYSRDLIWKYGIVRREMMGPVPSQTQAKQWLKKIIDSETASAARSRPSQF
ncbi:hypothetical protein BGX23_011272 [Mortierella sp. AD031]|nr:hypothetical protein BGX23_011272 [Mortierella sp. AD031]